VDGCGVKRRDPFVVVRAHVTPSLASQLNGADEEFMVACWKSCLDVGSLTRRRVDYVQLLVSHWQRSDELTAWLGCQLDVPVNHAFIVHGAAAQLSLRHLRHTDTRHCLESVTVSPSCSRTVMSMSVRSHISETARLNFTNFLCISHMAVARSSSGDIAICYVLPVLWITSCFHTMVSVVRRERNNRNYYVDSNQILLIDQDQIE